MDWHTFWAAAYSMENEIVILLIVLSTIATYFVYSTYDTGLYCTAIVFGVLMTSGFAGHIYCAINGIFFTFDIGRSSVIAATLAMTATFIISVFVLRVVGESYDGRHHTKKATSEGPQNRSYIAGTSKS